jgi:predicted metal-binding membrane protein
MMLALLAVSMMNLPAMVVLGVLITLEKQWRYGETLAKVVGVAALVYAAAIAIDGDLAPGSIDKGGMDEMEMDEMEMDEMEMDEMEMDDPMALPS